MQYGNGGGNRENMNNGTNDADMVGEDHAPVTEAEVDDADDDIALEELQESMTTDDAFHILGSSITSRAELILDQVR